MIVAWSDLPQLAGKVVMVDGSFDPLHEGHIAYFDAAAQLGRPVLCNITSDERTSLKHPVLLPQESRARVIDAVRFVSYVHSARGSTRDVLEQLRPHIYVKGNDWLARGGVPSEEVEVCARLSIEVKYVDTVLNSSTWLIERMRSR
jgi:D-beta-D-heptose 7-phosphate kinase/D-beta-D-heptose 1-phosphate adenosyltransferase